MKKVTGLVAAVLSAVFLFTSNSQAADAKLGSTQVKAGTPITVSGTIEPGQELYVTVASEKMFAPQDAPGPKEKSRLTNGKNGKNAFGDTEIPASFYVVTSAPETLAAPKEVWKGQTKGLFAFPPFKYRVMVNKILSWEKIDPSLIPMLGPVSTEAQWKFVTFTHEKKFGINTVSKEPGKGGGNARMIMSDYTTTQERWNEGVAVELDKATGKFSVSMTPYKNLAPETKLAVYVNGDKVDTVTIEKSGFFFATGNVYMNPLVVFGGAFIIGMLFVIMGAAGGLFTAAFQITVVGTKGPIGINAGNTIKPTNLFLTMCSPITGLMTFVKEKRFAYPVAIPFAIGIVAGAFFIGPPLSAKYLNLAAFKFYLGIICLVIGIKLFTESLPSAIAKKKAMQAIVKKFNAAVKEAKESGKAMEMGKVEFEKFNFLKFNISFWGETFVARPLMMLVGGVLMGIIASAFGVGGGFMFMPFMTTLVGYPMYLAVPIALAGTFATSIGAVAKYTMLGYQPDWVMAALIAAGAMLGGIVGPKIQKMLPEIFLKRMLALALILTCLKYADLLWFLR
ncbi:sulfite exporter TauE/SafE family protein [Desulfobulbus rhabdoformis]|uniref:sulfite exporter TauE/SafE family protein n=1 Tax=Desulfobulbus rhabdoformis TaxID=34032 RepID=UPI0019659E31|nr:sulfite exporter TauE/SafE family protein [Desulfobulbus rhabdoformis]MBM9613557.1 sulfite exporter TauE/SafE family protein [Desulfobulbus rhabdoformis]